MYLIIKNSEVVECQTALELAFHGNVTVTDSGKVYINGMRDTMSHNMKEWTNAEARENFARTRLSRYFTIYKAERL